MIDFFGLSSFGRCVGSGNMALLVNRYVLETYG